MEKCTHPESERENYHDNSVLCNACNCVIEQNGKALSEPSKLGYIFPLSTSPGCYLPGTMPEGWGLVRHEPGKIVLTHKDGSGVLIREDADSIAETLFYRMMDQILLGK